MSAAPHNPPAIDLSRAVPFIGSRSKTQAPARTKALRSEQVNLSRTFAPELGERLWAGPAAAAAGLKAPDLTAAEVGIKADPFEWGSEHIAGVYLMPALGASLRTCGILYQDGVVERCLVSEQGVKQGPYQLYYALGGYELHAVAGQQQLFESSLLKENGTYCLGLPCGDFSVWDENKVLIAWGRYELVESSAPDALSLDLLELQEQLIGPESILGQWRANLPGKRNKKRRPEPKPQAQYLSVAPDTIIVRYQGLSRALNGATQTFCLGPEVSALKVSRAPNETWSEACSRTHAQVLRAVTAQIAALQQAQRAADELHRSLGQPPRPLNRIAPLQLMCFNQAPERTTTLPNEVLAGAKDNKLAYESSLELLAQVQAEAVIAGCERGGFARLDLGYLPQTDDGAYLMGLLLSSPQHLEELCVRVIAQQPPKVTGPFYGLSTRGALVMKPRPEDFALPLWSKWAQEQPLTLPATMDADLTDFQAAFAWQAEGRSDLFDDQGAPLGSIDYGPLGLMHGALSFLYEKPGLAEYGVSELGLIAPSFTYIQYQNFHASFPASILTVDRITGEFDGPYQVIEDLDELFAQGYHRTLLHREETYGPNGREVRNTLAPYRPDTFVREYGFYHQGVPQPN